MHGEIENVQLGLVQLVDHEADDFLALLGDHADAVALAQAAEEVLFGPGEFEALRFGLQDFGHVAANYPADMDLEPLFFSLGGGHVFLLATLGS